MHVDLNEMTAETLATDRTANKTCRIKILVFAALSCLHVHHCRAKKM